MLGHEVEEACRSDAVEEVAILEVDAEVMFVSLAMTKAEPEPGQTKIWLCVPSFDAQNVSFPHHQELEVFVMHQTRPTDWSLKPWMQRHVSARFLLGCHNHAAHQDTGSDK